MKKTISERVEDFPAKFGTIPIGFNSGNRELDQIIAKSLPERSMHMAQFARLLVNPFSGDWYVWQSQDAIHMMMADTFADGGRVAVSDLLKWFPYYTMHFAKGYLCVCDTATLLSYPQIELAARFKQTRAFKTLFKDFSVWIVDGRTGVELVSEIYKSQDPNHKRLWKVQ